MISLIDRPYPFLNRLTRGFRGVFASFAGLVGFDGYPMGFSWAFASFSRVCGSSAGPLPRLKFDSYCY